MEIVLEDRVDNLKEVFKQLRILILIVEPENVEERKQVVHATVIINAFLVEVVVVNNRVLQQLSVISAADVVNYRLVFDLRSDKRNVDQEQVLVQSFTVSDH